MRDNCLRPISGRAVRFLAVGLALLLLAACRAPAELPLVIPTVASTAIVEQPPTTGATLPAVSTATLPPAPTILPPTATQPPPATATPLVAPTVTPAAPTPPPVSSDTTYRVAFVAPNDTLNVRAGPGVNYPAIAQLPPDAGGIVVADEGQTLLGGSTWVPIATGAGEGWVNSRFLTETVRRDDFCADPAVGQLLAQLQAAVTAQDGARLQSLVHPERGLRLRVNWWNEEVFLPGSEARSLFAGQPSFGWGIANGSGLPIEGSFNEVMLPLLQRDLLGAMMWTCDEIVHGPTAGSVILPEGYDALHFFSAHRPAPADQEFDWGTWVVGIDRWQGSYYLSYLIHYQYEI